MSLAYGDDRFMILLALNAFEAAFHRWEAVRAQLDEATAFAPLAECLWWADSVDARMHELEGPSYRARRDRDQDGRLLLGIHWARNRTGHDHALVLRYQPSTELGRWVLGVSRLGERSELLWRDAAELPRGRSQVGRDVYERHLRGRPVRDAVAAARRWFHGGARSSGRLDFGPPAPV